MAGRYSFDDERGERQPLGRSSPPQHQQYQQQYQQQYSHPQQQYPQQPEPYYADPHVGAAPRTGPANHPDSTFGRLRAQRRMSQEGPRGSAGAAASSVAADMGRRGREPGYPPAPQRQPTQSTVTPGADNFGESAAGGMAGIAYSVADHNARQSGLDAARGPDYPQQAYQQQGQWANQGQGQSSGRVYAGNNGDYGQQQAPYTNAYADDESRSSLQNLSAAPRTPGHATPGQRTPSRSPQHSFTNELYSDNPYTGNLSRPQHPGLGVVDPHAIEDDGDDGLGYHLRNKRSSMLSLGSSHRGAGVAGGAAAGGVLGALAGRNGSNSGLSSQYAPVNNTAYEGHGPSGLSTEKAWEAERSKPKSKKWKLVVIGVVVSLIIIGIALGVVLGVVLKNKGGDDGKSAAAAVAEDNKDDLNINSSEIKALMNNKNLHKVFPGVDYTPLNAQYPDCMHHPPSQNNITRDVAVLSQLTNTIKLYGTDCNQTEMVIHSLRQLKLEDTMKIWMGVWQDNNATTNKRQLSQMYDVLDMYGDKHFKGIVVANEILFREQMTLTTLGNLLADVRSKLRAKNLHLPVATADLGDKWTAELAAQSDYIMANIHPFFAGVKADQSAQWTWSFWENHNKPFFKSDLEKNIISEVGWPSQGGTNCGVAGVTDCPNASKAGIPEMNLFMENWVCQALTNGTQYFLFEAFDEPWKVVFNEAGKNWEDHWGIMDVNRKLKPGVKIPDCGGKTV